MTRTSISVFRTRSIASRPLAAFADHPHVDHLGQELAQTTPHDRVIVNDGDLHDGVGHLSRSGLR
jgi:hypothetical protein